MSRPTSNITAYIGIGANLDDRARACWEAVYRLGNTPQIEVTKISNLVETAAVGGPEGSPPFLNGALEIHTSLGAHALLQVLLQIEQSMGRHRNERWAPRTIDLDILLFGDKIISSDTLVIPHPLMHQRRFVLEPLAQIAPNVVHPMLQMTISGLLATV